MRRKILKQFLLLQIEQGKSYIGHRSNIEKDDHADGIENYFVSVFVWKSLYRQTSIFTLSWSLILGVYKSIDFAEHWNVEVGAFVNVVFLVYLLVHYAVWSMLKYNTCPLSTKVQMYEQVSLYLLLR